MKNLGLYLAHPFDSRKYIREWELKVEKKFDVELVNPFYDVTRDDVEKIDLGRAKRYEKLDPVKLVRKDLAQIEEAMGVVAIIDGSLSYGTIMEIVYACYYRKPVYIIVTNGHIKHPWIQYHASGLFESFKEFEKWLKKKTK